jgi:hypothetical protein
MQIVGEVVAIKAVQTIFRTHPDIVGLVLTDRCDHSTGQTVAAKKQACLCFYTNHLTEQYTEKQKLFHERFLASYEFFSLQLQRYA